MKYNLLMSVYRSIIANMRGTITNTLALAIGIASVLFVANLLLYETSFDSELPDLYRVELRHGPGTTSYDAYTSTDIGSRLINDYSAIKQQVRFIPFSAYKSANMQLVTDSAARAVYFENIYFSDPSVVDCFDLKMLQGEATEFAMPGTMMISERTAIDHFGKVLSKAQITFRES